MLCYIIPNWYYKINTFILWISVLVSALTLQLYSYIYCCSKVNLDKFFKFFLWVLPCRLKIRWYHFTLEARPLTPGQVPENSHTRDLIPDMTSSYQLRRSLVCYLQLSRSVFHLGLLMSEFKVTTCVYVSIRSPSLYLNCLLSS